jgi:hypothetical protein
MVLARKQEKHVFFIWGGGTINSCSYQYICADFYFTILYLYTYCDVFAQSKNCGGKETAVAR